MRNHVLAVGLLLVGLLAVATPGQAAVQLQQQFSCDLGVSLQQPGILGVLSSGQTVVCVMMPGTVNRVGDTVQLTASVVGPTTLAAINPQYAQSFIGTGCTATTQNTAGATTTVAASSLAAVNAQTGAWNQNLAVGADFVMGINNQVTVTGNDCSALWTILVCQGASVGTCSNNIVFLQIPVNIHTLETQTTVMAFQCGSTGGTFTALSDTTSCGTLTANVANTGSMTLSGTINTVGSGTTHLVIDSWPSLTAAVANSGTLNVVNSGGQTMAVSGSLAVSGGLTVTNAGGQSLTVTSWPQLQAVLSGTVAVTGSVTVHNDGTLTVTNTGGQTMTLAGAATIHADGSLTVTNAGGQALTFAGPLTVHQDPICTAAAHCFVDGNQNTTLNVGSVNQNNTMASTFSLDIPLLDQWIPLLFWVGMVFFAYFRVNISGARYLMMFTFCILALFTTMIPSMALLTLYGGITCLVFCLMMITMLNRFGFFPAQPTTV